MIGGEEWYSSKYIEVVVGPQRRCCEKSIGDVVVYVENANRGSCHGQERLCDRSCDRWFVRERYLLSWRLGGGAAVESKGGPSSPARSVRGDSFESHNRFESRNRG